MIPPLHNLIPDLHAIIRETGAFIQSEAKNFREDKAERKGSNDLVSYVDKTAEDMLKAECKRLLPGSGFIAEEGEDEPGTTAWRWIIDPLDGTNNFVHGIPVYSISVALQYEEETILGVVYELNREEWFQAIKGEGATLNGQPIRVSERTKLADCVVATGFPYARTGRLPAIMAELERMLEKCRGIRRLGSAAVDLAYVACGRFDAYYEKTLNPWDMAAGILLVKEAGGAATDWKGTDNALFGRQIASSNGNVHQELIQTLNSPD